MLAAFIYFSDFQNKSAFITCQSDSSLCSTWRKFSSPLLSSRELRALVVEMVLATDMSCHFQQVKAMKNFLQQPEGSVGFPLPPFTLAALLPTIYICINPATKSLSTNHPLFAFQLTLLSRVHLLGNTTNINVYIKWTVQKNEG